MQGLVEQFPEAPLLQLGGEREGFLNLGAISSGEDEEGAAIFAAGRAAMVLLIKSLPAYEYFTKAQERGFQCGIIYSPEEVVKILILPLVGSHWISNTLSSDGLSPIPECLTNSLDRPARLKPAHLS